MPPSHPRWILQLQAKSEAVLLGGTAARDCRNEAILGAALRIRPLPVSAT